MPAKKFPLVRSSMIWGLAALFYFFDNLLNVSPSVMKPELSRVFQLSGAELGILSSCYLWAYGLMQIPAGLLMDKVGPRRLFTLASLLCAGGSYLFGVAEGLTCAILGRILIGIGASFAVVGCSKLASVWFPIRRFALLMGLMVAVGMLGGAVSLATVSSIVKAFGWREAMYWGAGVALVLSALLWLMIRDYPSSQGLKQTHILSLKQVLQGLSEVVNCPQAWIAALYAGLMFVPTLAFGGLWGTPYLVEAHGFEQELAGQLTALIFVGWVLGGPVYGWFSDHIGRRNPPMLLATLTTLIISILLIFINPLPASLVGTLMFLLGFFSSGFIIAFVVTRENNRTEIAGTAIGFMNMLNTFGVALFQWLIGWILDWVSYQSPVPHLGQGTFSLEDYQVALLSLPICLGLALFILLYLKETYCRSRVKS